MLSPFDMNKARRNDYHDKNRERRIALEAEHQRSGTERESQTRHRRITLREVFDGLFFRRRP